MTGGPTRDILRVKGAPALAGGRVRHGRLCLPRRTWEREVPGVVGSPSPGLLVQANKTELVLSCNATSIGGHRCSVLQIFLPS